MRGPKGANPSRVLARTPGWLLIRVPCDAGDRFQVLEAQRAKHDVRVRYLGAARGLHLLERPPVAEANR